jgi:hypothetical protein
VYCKKGAAFDRDLQEQLKVKRATDREKKEAENVKKMKRQMKEDIKREKNGDPREGDDVFFLIGP